jgi:hypothetical protein
MHFWLLTARLSLEKGDEGSTVPKKMDLYWFILGESTRVSSSEKIRSFLLGRAAAPPASSP